MLIVQALVIILAVYALVGVLFAAAFATVGIARVDAQAKSAPLAFRLLIAPGAAALWPVLLRRWMNGRGKA